MVDVLPTVVGDSGPIEAMPVIVVDGSGAVVSHTTASGLTPVTGTLASVTQSSTFTPTLARPFNVTQRRTTDFAGSYQLERKFTGDANWYVVLAYSDLTSLPETFSLTETESGVTYRWNMTAWTAGSVTVRISA